MEPELPKYLTTILHDVGTDDRESTAILLPLVYRELRAMAGGFFKKERSDHTLQPTALVHEVYLRVSGDKNFNFASREHFFAIAARVMRQIMIDSARTRLAQKRGGDWKRVTINQEIALTSGCADLDVLALEDALSKLEKLHERQGRIVELRFLAGLGVEQVAEVLGISPRTVELEWRTARAFLNEELSAEGTA